MSQNPPSTSLPATDDWAPPTTTNPDLVQGDDNDNHSDAAPQLAVDPDFAPGHGDDSDSGVDDGESSLLSSTASLNSSIFDYRKLHGRTYHNYKDVEYWGPNDDKQNEGLDLSHHMMLLLHDHKLFLSPIENVHEVLDVGTGTGIWAMDFADQFPSAKVTGTDVSPIQPSWTPPNCFFELDDASQDWAFADNTFDFIHIRLMLGSIEDWVKLYQQAYRCLKPGGWLEHSDFSVVFQSDDGSVPQDSAYTAWNQFFTSAGEATRRTFRVTENGRNVAWMTEAGFPGPVHVRNFKLPVGSWPAERRWKEIGLVNQLSIEQGLEGYALYLGTNVLGWSYDEIQVLLAKVRLAVRNKSYHAYYPCSTVWAQKPIG